MEVRARICVPDAEPKEIYSSYIPATPTPESTKGLSSMLQSISAVQKQAQDYLTEIVNRDPSSSADTAALEDLYGEEGAGEDGDEDAPSPQKKKQKKKK